MRVSTPEGTPIGHDLTMPSAPISDTSYFQMWSKALPRRNFVDRDEFLLSRAAGKSVLHLGAADAPFHKEKAEAGALLHQKLARVAGHLQGIDADEDAVNYLRNHHGIHNIAAADVCAAPSAFALGSFDVILCCDIVEHVCEPAALLRACAQWMHRDSRLIVTTVNALSAKAALRAAIGREAVHPDHVSYFSYATLAQLLIRNGFRPLEYATFAYPTVTRRAGVLFGLLHRIRPSTADGIIIVAAASQR
jgi:2-polyprenyl-3-methyl-5-hydroxy-6-metoxy-1,4-benzoquinol methylase